MRGDKSTLETYKSTLDDYPEMWDDDIDDHENIPYPDIEDEYEGSWQ